MVDESGNIYLNNNLLTLLTKLFLESSVKNAGRGEEDCGSRFGHERSGQELAREYGVELIYTKNTHADMMRAASEEDIAFVGGTLGGAIFPDYFFAVDGLFTVAKMLEMLAVVEKNLGDVARDMPRYAQSRKTGVLPDRRTGQSHAPCDGSLARYESLDRRHQSLIPMMAAVPGCSGPFWKKSGPIAPSSPMRRRSQKRNRFRRNMPDWSRSGGRQGSETGILPLCLPAAPAFLLARRGNWRGSSSRHCWLGGILSALSLRFALGGNELEGDLWRRSALVESVHLN